MTSLLDNVVQAMFSGTGPQVSSHRPHTSHTSHADFQQQQAQRVLAQFQEHPDAWQRVPPILETSQNPNTKVSCSR